MVYEFRNKEGQWLNVLDAGAEGEIKNLKTAITEQKQKTSHIANTLAMAEKEFAANLAGDGHAINMMWS